MAANWSIVLSVADRFDFESSALQNNIHYVRIGVLGHVGRFSASDGVIHPRGRRVICRTRRGLELGEVLNPATREEQHSALDGNLVRAVTVEDDLLIARMEYCFAMQNSQDQINPPLKERPIHRPPSDGPLTHRSKTSL